MTYTLQQLVTMAQGLAGDPPCQSFGHAWVEVGGRRCRHSPNDFDCSQVVYQCERCGDFDYGEPGGPGDEHCRLECPDRVEACRQCNGEGELSDGIYNPDDPYGGLFLCAHCRGTGKEPGL